MLDSSSLWKKNPQSTVQFGGKGLKPWNASKRPGFSLGEKIGMFGRRVVDLCTSGESEFSCPSGGCSA